jgi:DNA polymerase III delta prime subunit
MNYRYTNSSTYLLEPEMNQILDRTGIEQQIKYFLTHFNKNYNEITFKKGIYIYGSPGCGKTKFIMKILKDMDYDVIKYDAGDVRNKSLIDTITSNNISNCNVLQIMKGGEKKIAIVMDEIDGMNNGDKGGITSLIKLIRQKKTKKQKLENKTFNPVICIGNYYIDKKIKELMKVCHTFELQTPTVQQMDTILWKLNTSLYEHYLKDKILDYVQGDLRKLYFIYSIYSKRPELINEYTMTQIFIKKIFNEDAKKNTKILINQNVSMKDHNTFMNETDRTTIALLWHENIVDTMAKTDKSVSFPFYYKILQNMCFADYTDRITFQNQIWQFNEMSSLIKTFHNNKIFHDVFPEKENKFHPAEVRFTKVLTKYSTEYNNTVFIFNLCQELDMDKKDLIAFFQELRLFYGKDFYNNVDSLNQVSQLFDNLNINKLDIKRMYRYLDKNVKKDILSIDDETSEDGDKDI